MRYTLLAGMCAWVLSRLYAGDAPPAATTTPAPPAPTAYAFTAKANQLYVYSVKQAVAWESAGDQLSYTSTLTWKFALTVAETSAERAVLDATILRVQATHDGPGSHRQVDSGAKDGDDGGNDPLLGHLIALNGAILRVVVAPGTGQVSEVSGGDAIIARINKRAPAQTPGDTPPLDAAARAAFSGEALTRIWNQLLALPAAGTTRVPLGPPLNGEIERSWTGNTYHLKLPGGVDHLNATLVGDPTPVAVVLSELTGTGTTNQTKGMPGPATGELSFKLTFQALTQPVVQRHTLSWELTPMLK
jgi:hypothetical protein